MGKTLETIGIIDGYNITEIGKSKAKKRWIIWRNFKIW